MPKTAAPHKISKFNRDIRDPDEGCLLELYLTAAVSSLHSRGTSTKKLTFFSTCLGIQNPKYTYMLHKFFSTKYFRNHEYDLSAIRTTAYIPRLILAPRRVNQNSKTAVFKGFFTNYTNKGSLISGVPRGRRKQYSRVGCLSCMWSISPHHIWSLSTEPVKTGSPWSYCIQPQHKGIREGAATCALAGFQRHREGQSGVQGRHLPCLQTQVPSPAPIWTSLTTARKSFLSRTRSNCWARWVWCKKLNK